jgi:hypothetical protein
MAKSLAVFEFSGLLVFVSMAALAQAPAPAQGGTAPPANQGGTAPATQGGTPPSPATHIASASPPGGKSLSQSLGMLVYPAKQQSSTQQSQDEYDCYNWSKTQSGYDPLTASTQSAQASQSAAQPRRGLRGAAGGAAVGAIAGNAGAGAAAGAAAGVLKGASERQKADAQHQSAQSQATAAQQQNVDTFKRGMSACLESRGYTVK